MYDMRGAGKEKCMTEKVQDMSTAERRDAGHEECMTGGVQDMRNA